MTGIVMEWRHALHLGQPRERRKVADGAVTPSHVRVVFGVGVLGVVDEEVRPMRQIEPGRPLRGRWKGSDAQRGLVIRQVGQHFPGRARYPVPDGGAWMADEVAPYAHAANTGVWLRVVKLEPAGHLSQRYREERRRKVAADAGVQRHRDRRRSPDVYL